MKRHGWCLVMLAVLLLTPSTSRAQQAVQGAERAVPPAPYVVSPNRAAVAAAIDACAASVTCAFLSDFKAQSEQAYRWVQAWCRWREARGQAPGAGTASATLCEAVAPAESAKVDRDALLASTPALVLEAVRDDIAPPRCDAFGLTVPLYSLRRQHGEVVASGPVKAGLGGGYYFGQRFLGVCRPDFTAGPEVFVWSEGLDPGDLFHTGLAAGYQLTAFKYFSVGIAVGYDLYRSTSAGDRNGILAGKGMGKQSVTWLLTLNFSSTSAAGAGTEAADAP